MQSGGFEKLNHDGRLTQITDTPAGKGIDGIWKNTNPPPDFVISEAKFGKSKLGSTLDGKQMSDDWLTGVNTGFDRLKAAVGPKKATEILDAINEGRVEKWLPHIDEAGVVTKKIIY